MGEKFGDWKIARFSLKSPRQEATQQRGKLSSLWPRSQSQSSGVRIMLGKDDLMLKEVTGDSLVLATCRHRPSKSRVGVCLARAFWSGICSYLSPTPRPPPSAVPGRQQVPVPERSLLCTTRTAQGC